MCRSMFEGGQRCASHTREKLTLKAAAVEAAVSAFSDGTGDPVALRTAQDEWEKAAAEYASTDEGHTHLSAQAAAADDMDTSALLNTVIVRGEALRAANRETAALIKAVRLAKAEPVTAAAGGLVASTDVDVMSPEERLLPVVPDLSAKARAAWAAGLKAFDEMGPSIESVTIHTRSGASDHKPAEVRQELAEIDEQVGDPSLDDVTVARLVGRIDHYCGMRMVMPRFVPLAMERNEGERLDAFQDRRHEASSARSRQWSEFARAFEKVLTAQGERAVAHPGAGVKTFETAQERGVATAEQLTARPNAPIGYLHQVARNAPTKVAEAGWVRLREERLRDDGTHNDGVAMLLAMHDQDAAHRNDAYAQVEVMNFDNVDRKQRTYLATNLHRLPGAPARQAILASSLVEWAKMSSDADERKSLFRTLQASKTPEVAAVGDKALAGAGLAASDDVAGSEDRKGWFSRR